MEYKEEEHTLSDSLFVKEQAAQVSQKEGQDQNQDQDQDHGGKVGFYRPIRLVPGAASRRAVKQAFPPKQFVDTIATSALRQCANYCLILWLLNGSVRLTTRFYTCERPFQLFKCKLQRTRYTYEEFFELHDAPAADEDRTLTEDCAPVTEISIFPKVVQLTKLDQFKMDRLLGEYVSQFVNIVRGYGRRRYPENALYLSENLTKLLQSYANDVLHDIFFKHTSWSRIIGSTGAGAEHSYSSLLVRFWTHYFLLSTGPLGNFTSELRRMTDTNALRQHAKGPVASSASKLCYGVWIDSRNGILLLCNGVASSQMLGTATPTIGLNLDSRAQARTNVKKLLLFVNLCIVECCTWEL